MRILFCYNNELSLTLAEWLEQKGHILEYCTEKLDESFFKDKKFDLLISYNYISIIRQNILEIMHGNAINLHISFLPWNKGLKPNIWSFLLDTPKGVTIHFMDKGIDTGKIILQKKVEISMEETLHSSYTILHQEIQTLFKENFHQYETWKNIAFTPSENGNYNTEKDFSRIAHLITSWEMKIIDLKHTYEQWMKQNIF